MYFELRIIQRIGHSLEKNRDWRTQMAGMARMSAEHRATPLMRRILGNTTGTLGIFLLALAMGACRRTAQEPVTLSYLGWSQPDELPTSDPLAQRFTRETGIRVKHLPVPEISLSQLDLSRKLLHEGSSGPDVLSVDVIWAGVLQEDLIDLRPYLAAELPSLEPKLVPIFTVDGKLVTVPYQVQVGVLEYRTDLLREYGFDHPPTSWDELEKMAARIQAGEREKGNKDFWGYVWQGADAESLTCNALEWQVAEGGGQIIEDGRTISVNNPAAIRSWLRAKRWIGWISPPGVIAYRENDSMNAFDSGSAAFNRVWGGATGGVTIRPKGQSRLIHWRSSLPIGKTGYMSIPGGRGGQGGTLGGSGLAISRHSAHPQEAIEFVRFLIRTQIQSNPEQGTVENLPAQPEVYDLRSALNSEKSDRHKSGVIARPSTLAGSAYEQVTRAYFGAVHSVLNGDIGAAEAAAELEKQLVKITGFKAGPPKT